MTRPMARHRGIAMLLVLLSVTIAVILTMSFQSAQSTTVPIAQNISNQTGARGVAESAMSMLMAHVKSSDTWRDDFAAGDLPTNQPWANGTFSISVEDGEDLDGDGVITQPDEGDGDLADDVTDPATFTVIARFNNVTHRLHTVVHAGNASPTVKLLYVLDSGGPSTLEQTRIDLFESWGFTVVTISENATRATFDATIADEEIEVIYLSTLVQNSATDEVDHQIIGIVTEEQSTYDQLGIAANGANYTGSTIDIVDNSHYITSPFASGTLTVTTQDISLKCTNGTTAAGLTELAHRPTTSTPTLGVMERGAITHDSGRTPGRRVMLPWSGSDYDFHPTTDGKKLIRRAIEWAADTAPATTGLWAEWFDVSTSLGSLNAISWDSAPTHTSIESNVNWSSTSGALYSGGPTETFGLKLRGKITIPADGSWTFYLESDDGSDLAIDGTTIVNHDGQHGMTELSGSVTLTEGEHDIVIRFFENSGAGGLILKWQGPSQSKDVVPSSALTVGPGDEESEDEPQLIALYRFATPDPIDPTLVAQWKLDESSATTGGGLAAGGDVLVDDYATIDAYSSGSGAYGGANAGMDASISTNNTGSSKLIVKNSSTLTGNAYCGAGGSPSSAISTSSGGTISGTRAALSANIANPSYSAPSGVPASSEGTVTVSSNTTWSSNKKVDDLNITGGTLTINGNLTVDVTSSFNMSGSSRISIPSGSSLTLYVYKDSVIDNSARINYDSSNPGQYPGRFRLINYDSGYKVEVKNSSIIVGSIFSEGLVLFDNQAVLYGSVHCSSLLTIKNNSAVHVDLAQASLGLPFTIDEENGSYPGTAVNGPTVGQSAQVSGTAISFDGSNDYITVPHNSDFLLDNGTLSFWFRTDDATKTQGLITKDSAGYDNGGHLSVLVYGQRVYARLQSTSSDAAVESDPISGNTWYHVALTWGGGGMKLYLNGSLVDSDSYTGGLGTSSGGTGNTEPWVFGANSWNSDDNSVTPLQDYFDGLLDDVRIYDDALVESQIANLAGGSDPGPATPPIVYDTSGYGSALDLTIADPNAVTWSTGGGLVIDSATTISSGSAASKLHTALTETDEVTIELIVTPANITQGGAARIATLSADAFNCNITVGQEQQTWLGKLRTSSTSSSGAQQASGNVLTAAQQYHLVFTYDGEQMRLYRDGVLEAEATRIGSLDTWNAAYAFVLGSEPGGETPWLGTFHRVAVWDRGMNSLQVQNLYQGLEPGDGQSDIAFTFRWVEAQ